MAPPIAQAHEDGLKNRNAIYPIQKIKSNNFTIAKGSKSECREILIGSDCPKLVIVGFVSNVAFNGDFKKNPFLFHHYDVEFKRVVRVFPRLHYN